MVSLPESNDVTPSSNIVLPMDGSVGELVELVTDDNTPTGTLVARSRAHEEVLYMSCVRKGSSQQRLNHATTQMTA